MAFCSNCGQQLDDKAKFCSACGTSRSVQQTANENKRKIVYEGEIRKCPNCGEVVDAFTVKCPACGFELNSKKVSSVLQDFIKEINECEKNIANSSTVGKSGWSSWSKSKRFWWVVLNLLFVCIPLVIYLALPLVTLKLTPKLTSEEKKMASLIENFPFPNDRESILSALVFAKEKIDFISKESINRKTAYWMRLWCAKAEQLKQKADLLFPNDSIVKDSYNEITADENRVNRIIKIKAIVGLVILVIAVVFCIIRYGSNVGVTDSKDYNATFEWQTTGLFAELPEPDTTNGKIVMETEKQVSIELYNIETADFEAYVKSCREAGFTVDVTKTDMVFYAKDDAGYNLSIFYYDNKDLMNVVVSSYDIENEMEDKTNNDAATPTTAINVKNFTFNLPDYWDEEGSKNEYLQYYAEKGDKVVMLSIAYPEESDDNYDVSFKGLEADNDNMVKAVAGMFTDGDVVDHEVFESDHGVKGMLYRFTYKQKIDWNTKVDGSGYCFCFPSESDRRWFYVVLLHTNNVSSNDYKDDYMSMLADIKEK